MTEENQNGLLEAAEKGASAANSIRGAIKTGKAVEGATKGVATSGPYGAIAGVLWAGKMHFGKIVLAAVISLLLPVLYVLMLPPLLFGGLTNAFSLNNPEVPILNDSATITENVSDLSFTVNSILAEGMDDVITRINSDFASSGGNRLEIINSYETGAYFNINLFISQYCAAKNQDFESISKADMENLLRSNKHNLYSYSRREETRQTTDVTEVWMIYTIVYNGESYFADMIFRLDDEQKKLARDYAYNMSLFLGDGLFQGLLDSEFIPEPSYEGVKFADGQMTVVYYNQLDERFANEPYGTDNIGGYGCGPTAMAIVVSSLTSETVDPIQMARWSYGKGYWCSKSGSYHALIPNAAKAWGLTVEGCIASEPQRIVDALSSGKLVVAIMSKGHFTKSGHFIVLRGVTSDGKILVADPASYTRSEQKWELSIILNEASAYAAAGGPFWIIGSESR